jgi:CRISPR type III-B/RAMP module-associated protein Cmr5
MTTAHPTRPTLSQRRAAHAWSAMQHISEVIEKGEKKYLQPNTKSPGANVATEAGKKLGSEIKKLPTRIIASGLGQAIAFLHAKESEPVLERILAHWLLMNRPREFDPSSNFDGKDLIQKLIKQTSTSIDLRDMTAEALAYLPWLGRFAEGVGLMEKPDDREGDKQ